MKAAHPALALILVWLLSSWVAHACLWDGDTLADEKKQHPTLAEAILHPTNEVADTPRLMAKIESLRAAPKENEPAWWNDLAGAYIRVGQSAEAVRILEPLTNRFPEDYGIHANLGTAYHLLGRYSDAEREIARDLEINPEPHFGLEKYHLALLQYLIRDERYRLRHVYLDEFSNSFLAESGMRASSYPSPAEPGDSAPDSVKTQGEQWTETLLKDPNYVIEHKNQLYYVGKALADLAQFEPPAYKSKQALDGDPNLEKGVIYMATLNPREPACWVMLGILAAKNSDKHLTIAAYRKAIELGSIQAPILRSQIDGLKEHIRKARANSPAVVVGNLLPIVFLLCMGLVVLIMYRPEPEQSQAQFFGAASG